MYDGGRNKQDFKKLQGHSVCSGSDHSINKLYDLLDAILDAKIEDMVLHRQALTFLREDNSPVLFLCNIRAPFSLKAGDEMLKRKK